MPDIQFFDAVSDVGLAGGKGLSLGRMAAAGLPVPPGFVVTTEAYRRAVGGIGPGLDVAAAIEGAYARLGGGPVAVRSSATAEDAADASFAGQQATFLGVEGAAAVVNAVGECWGSLHTERAVAYRARQGVDAAGLAMAVVVQRLVPAEVAGVLFTRDPLDPAGETMLVEASWGLGEAVVSGRVTPDRFRLAQDGTARERQPGDKAVRVTPEGDEPVPVGDRHRLCLDDAALSQLADLGRRVETFYGDARDIEWAFAGGTFYLLQARPITVATAADREQVRQAVIADLRAKADPAGTVWVRYNLSEVLPAPTPMTWAVVQRLLAADGGFGLMNRDLGANPDPALGSQGAFDLVAGRPMCNLSRLPRMQFARPPFEYPFAAYKADPAKALDPKPVMNPLRGGVLSGLWRLPGTMKQLSRMMAATKAGAETFADCFTKEIAPPFVAGMRQALGREPTRERPTGDPEYFVRGAWVWVESVLAGFARHSLKPTVFADLAWSTLVGLLTPTLGGERAKAAVAELSLGAKPPPDADLGGAVRDLAAGKLDRAAFLERFGHRGPNEMELSQPRWSEAPGELDRVIGTAAAGLPAPPKPWEAVADEAKLTGPKREEFRVQVERLRTYLGLREAGKHYLLMGYAVIRKALVELDRRFNLNGGVFYLTPDDFPDLLAGKDLSAKVAAARKRRQAELALEVPPVLFSDDLDAIGRPLPPPPGGDLLAGVALSAGVAEGPALVLTEPTAAPPGDGYILVCPSTDPAWVPLFVRAKGLVMETGGVLSHGAIVAREFGLPAVAGLPGVTRRLKSGQVLRVDGGRGTVTVGG